MNTNVELVKELSKNGKSLKVIRATLLINDEALTDKEITKIIRDAGIGKSRGDGKTFPEVLQWLSEEPRTEKELYSFLLEEATLNEGRWVSDRNKVRETINSVFRKGGVEITEESASKELVEGLRDKVSKKAPKETPKKEVGKVEEEEKTTERAPKEAESTSKTSKANELPKRTPRSSPAKK